MVRTTSAGSIGCRCFRWLVQVAIASSLSLTTPLGAQQYSFKHYLREQGLTNLVVVALLQDRMGFIWAGTQNGLFRYDGDRFKRFGVAEGLPSSRVYSLHESTDGTLWVGTEQGLAYRVDRRFEQVGEGNESGAVFDIDSAKSGVVYVATLRGLFQTSVQDGDGSANRVEFSPAAFEVSGRDTNTVHVDPSGTVWFGCGRAICETTDSGVRVWGPKNGIPGARWDDIVTDPDGAVWVRSSRHLRVLRSGAERFVAHEDGLPSTSLYGRLICRKSGQIVVSTDRGVAFQEENGWRLVSADHGLPTPLTSSLLEDREGSLWIGLRGSGVARWLGEERWQHWTEAEGLTSNAIRAIRRDPKHGIWVGTDDGLNLLLPEGGVRHWTKKEGLAGNAVRSLTIAGDGAVWVGSHPGGVTRLDPATGHIRSFGPSSGLENDRTMGVHIGPEGRLWVATDGGLYNSHHPDRFARFEKQRIPGLDPHVRHTRLLTSRDGSLWVASHHGLLRHKDGQWTRLTRADGLRADAVMYLAQGPAESILIGYLDAVGASRVRIEGEQVHIEHFGLGDGPSSDKVLFLAFDLSGRFWYGSDAGVDMYYRGNWRHYTRADGLVWDSCNGDAFLAETDGSVWIGTSRGLSHFWPEREPEVILPPTVVITAATLGETRIEPKEIAEVSYEDRALSVQFTALTFRREGDVRFRCRLLGWEDDWVEAGQRQVRYGGLSPGSYTFEVRANDEAGLWSSEPARLAFKIKPPWWGTWWLRTAVLFALVLTGRVVWKMRLSRLKTYHTELEAAVIERTSALRLAKAHAERESAVVEHQKQRIEELLRQAQLANRHKSEFLANMSHEIRTPMNGVIGMTAILGNTELSVEQRDYVETIRGSGETLLQVINDILDFSKIEEGRLEIEEISFDLRDCFEQALDVIAPAAAEKGLEAGYLVEPNPPPLLVGDPTRVRQVLVNLLGNAVKFTSRGEILAVGKATRIDEDRSKVHVTIRDTGIGIPSEKQRDIFGSFSQVDTSTTRRFGGTGLGLAICKRLVEMMGGNIWVESELEHGSTFHFTITARAEHSAGNSPRDERGSTTGTRVLIVDDNATSRKILRKLTESWHMIPTEVASGREALPLIREGLRFDVGLLDMMMPVMDGVALASELKRQPNGADLPLILLTSLNPNQSHDTGGESSDAYFEATLTKPIKQSSLFDGLVSVLDGRQREPQAPRHESIDTTLGQRSSLRILVTEDNAVNRKVLLKILETLGYEADVAADGHEALETLRRRSYDIVFMDVQMPNMDGLEATRRIRSGWSDTDRPTIIGLTANALKGDREICLEAGMDDYVTKPIRVEQIRDLVRKYDRAARTEPAPGYAERKSGLDRDVLRDLTSQLGDDAPEFLKEFIEMFVTETVSSLEKLRHAASEGDLEAVSREAHGLKGSSLYVGAVELAALSAKLEASSKAPPGDGTADLIDRLETEFSRVREDLLKTTLHS